MCGPRGARTRDGTALGGCRVRPARASALPLAPRSGGRGRRARRGGDVLSTSRSRLTMFSNGARRVARRLACAQLMRAQDHSVRFHSVTDGTRHSAGAAAASSTVIRNGPSSCPSSSYEPRRARSMARSCSCTRRPSHSPHGMCYRPAAGHAAAPPSTSWHLGRRSTGCPTPCRPGRTPAPVPAPCQARDSVKAYYLPRQSDGSVPYDLCAPGRWPPLSLAH